MASTRVSTVGRGPWRTRRDHRQQDIGQPVSASPMAIRRDASQPSPFPATDSSAVDTITSIMRHQNKARSRSHRAQHARAVPYTGAGKLDRAGMRRSPPRRPGPARSRHSRPCAFLCAPSFALVFALVVVLGGGDVPADRRLVALAREVQPRARLTSPSAGGEVECSEETAPGPRRAPPAARLPRARAGPGGDATKLAAGSVTVMSPVR